MFPEILAELVAPHPCRIGSRPALLQCSTARPKRGFKRVKRGQRRPRGRSRRPEHELPTARVGRPPFLSSDTSSLHFDPDNRNFIWLDLSSFLGYPRPEGTNLNSNHDLYSVC